MRTVVDVHCHAFNAADLPVRGFIQRVTFDNRPVGRYLAALLDRLVQGNAPGFPEEEARLDALLQPPAFGQESLPVPAALDNVDVALLIAELEQTDPELLQALQDTMPQRESSFGNEGIGDALQRAVSWAALFGAYRVEVAAQLVRTYRQVDLFVPMLVDLSLGVEDREKTPIHQQIILHEKVSRLSMQGRLGDSGKGRLHPFIGFDPRRQLQAAARGDIETPLDTVKTAVERYGFVGVKLYPPMGFRPLGNDDRPGAGSWPGGAVDEVLREFYRWCVAEDVPITAHCNYSNGARNDYDGYSHPDGWAMVLAEFPQLHLNLGHFGGDAVERKSGDRNDWPERIAGLAREYPHVYADVGHHDVHEETALGAYLERLEQLFSQTATAAMEDRVLYGSDWLMLAILPDHEYYLAVYREAYTARFGADAAADFMGQRALRFLGFDDPGNKNAQRLATRYAAYAPQDRPEWLATPPVG